MSIVVAGSLNMDMVMRVPRLPRPGETLTGDGFALSEGGKGGNQAVACARLGSKVAMVGCIGADGFGQQLRAALERDGIDLSNLAVMPEVPTGVAMILVDAAGENCIALAEGANALLMPTHIDAAAPLIARARLLVLQLEVPLATVRHAVARAAAIGTLVLLNPAPARTLPDAVFQQVDYLVPNETEAGILTGAEVHDPGSAAVAARILRARGACHVLITLGAQGVFIAGPEGERHFPARRVKVVDTTAAGDAFIGGLAAGLDEGHTLDDAAQLGIAAAALCVTRAGAQRALPTRGRIQV